MNDSTTAADQVSLGDRIIAKLIDAGVLFGIAIVGAMVPGHGFIHAVLYLPFRIASLAYLLLGDALPGGQSIGKRVMKLRVADRDSGKPATAVQAALRSLPFLIPVVGAVVELVLLYQNKGEKRLGDDLAKTRVLRATGESAPLIPEDLNFGRPSASASEPKEPAGV